MVACQVLLALDAAYESSVRRSLRIVVVKLPDQSGGKYSIIGNGYVPDETVSLEIKNAPLPPPSGFVSRKSLPHSEVAWSSRIADSRSCCSEALS